MDSSMAYIQFSHFAPWLWGTIEEKFAQLLFDSTEATGGRVPESGWFPLSVLLSAVSRVVSVFYYNEQYFVVEAFTKYSGTGLRGRIEIYMPFSDTVVTGCQDFIDCVWATYTLASRHAGTPLSGVRVQTPVVKHHPNVPNSPLWALWMVLSLSFDRDDLEMSRSLPDDILADAHQRLRITTLERLLEIVRDQCEPFGARIVSRFLGPDTSATLGPPEAQYESNDEDDELAVGSLSPDVLDTFLEVDAATLFGPELPNSLTESLSGNHDELESSTPFHRTPGPPHVRLKYTTDWATIPVG
ncbi:hypothetical protein NX059_006206 [Plenodomus lindquistii]|nr:hypothetical protein NX059_006206 [Plenodomus lindquistii]